MPPRSRRAGQRGPWGLEEVEAAAFPGSGRACLPGPISWDMGSDPQVGTLSSLALGGREEQRLPVKDAQRPGLRGRQRRK